MCKQCLIGVPGWTNKTNCIFKTVYFKIVTSPGSAVLCQWRMSNQLSTHIDIINEVICQCANMLHITPYHKANQRICLNILINIKRNRN